MSELSFEQMLDESFKTIHNGEVVEGTVIDVKPEEIILNIGYKADGIITKNEYSNDPSVDLTKVVSVGDTMTVKVLKVNDGEGQVLLTYKRLAARKEMRDCVKRLRTKKSSKLQLHRFSEAAFALQLMKSECLSRQALYLILMRKILENMKVRKLNS